MIDLTDLPCRDFPAKMLDWGAMLTPALGGVTQKVDRLGTRFAISFETPPLPIEPDGRRAIALLQEAKQLGGRVRYYQDGFTVGAPGSPLVNGAHTGGKSLSVKSGTPWYIVRHGQALSLTVAGRSYLYFSAGQVQLNGSGSGTILLTTPMRKHMAGDEAVNLGAPVIEGWLDGDEQEWATSLDRRVPLKFSIEERA